MAPILHVIIGKADDWVSLFFDCLIVYLSVTIELIWIPCNFVVQNSSEFSKLSPDFV